MRAVNLIPADARRDGHVIQPGGLGPGFGVLALLGVALLLVTIYVLTSNTVADRKAKLAVLQAQVTQEQAVAGQLSSYATYTHLAQSRVATVSQIAQTRFDWHAALADLSRVVPANASLTSLVATTSPNSSVSGGGGGGGAGASALRGDIAAPAFQISGCTASHDDVARLISRLRLINGVQRVTLADSVKSTVAGATGTAAATPGSTACAGSRTNFDLVVFFRPLAGAPGTSAGTTPTSAATPAASTASAQRVSPSGATAATTTTTTSIANTK